MNIFLLVFLNYFLIFKVFLKFLFRIMKKFIYKLLENCGFLLWPLKLALGLLFEIVYNNFVLKNRSLFFIIALGLLFLITNLVFFINKILNLILSKIIIIKNFIIIIGLLLMLNFFSNNQPNCYIKFFIKSFWNIK